MTKFQLEGIEAFNKRVPIGTEVHYWTGAIEGPPKLGKTRSDVLVLNDKPVIFIEGTAGCIALTHVREIPVDLCSAYDRGYKGAVAHIRRLAVMPNMTIEILLDSMEKMVGEIDARVLQPVGDVSAWPVLV